ncbi:MAG: hypothetical protein ACRC2R_08320 [Xenococcaceae cyanobacterium]
MNLYEIFIANLVNFLQVAAIFSDFMNIPLNKIGATNKYYNQLNTIDELAIGIEIVNYSSKGYKTYVDIHHLGFEIKNSELVKLAYKLAETLNTDVAIGNVTEEGSFAYLIISADKKYQKAYELTDDNNEAPEFDPYTEKANVDEILKALDNN